MDVTSHIVEALVDKALGVIKALLVLFFAPFVRLYKERAHLKDILKENEDFTQWAPKSEYYPALSGLRVSETEPALDLLEGSLERGEPIVLLGEPGSGKTTAVQALTYRLAQRACWCNLLIWFFLLLIAALFLFVMPILALVWLALYYLLEPLLYSWERFARLSMVPIFLEARYFSSNPDDDVRKVRQWKDD